MAKQRPGARDQVELIEVFSPDDRTFDASPWPDERHLDGGTPDTPTQPQHSRRGVIVAGVLAIVAGVVGVRALTDDHKSDTSPPSTFDDIAPTSLTHFLIDDPTLTPYAADVVTPPSLGEQVQVWTNGSVFGPLAIIELHPHAYEPYGIVGATRDVVDGVELVRPIAQPDSVVSEVAIDDAWSITVRAMRLSDADFVRIARDLVVVDGKLVDESTVMEDLGLVITFEDESLDDLIFGRVESEVRYLMADGEIVTLRSAVGSSEDRLAGFRFLTTDHTPLFYGSSHGRLLNGDAIVVWEDEGRLLSLVAAGDALDLTGISLAVRRANDSEWSAMLYGLRPDYTLGDFETLATGHATNTELWRAGAQIAERNGRTEFLWWWTVPGLDDATASTPASSAVGKWPHFDTLVVPGATFVFVTHPAGANGHVTVHTAAGVELSAELMQPFPSQSLVLMTVVRVEEPGPVTVEIDGVEVTA